jgi:peptidoglycan hydrolase-like amidase
MLSWQSRGSVALRTLVFGCWAWAILGSSVAAQDVHIEVFGLFHPHELRLSPASGSALVIHAGDETLVLEESSAQRSMRIRVMDDHLSAEIGGREVNASSIHVNSRNQTPAKFLLEVPGRIRRNYSGALEISVDSGVLLPVVTMDLETAVASVVQAENDPGTPLEALKAQAIAARSYFSATGFHTLRGRHHHSNFCDTTHCQFLREQPTPNSAAASATLATRGLVLAYEDRPFSAMYTRSCGGRTRTASEIGLATNGYPYFQVACSYCARNPFRWSRRFSLEDAADVRASNETARLHIDRRLGWDAVPSNSFTVHTEGKSVRLEGTGRGHGVGLCQNGARAMAERGATFRDILNHYYPNTRLMEMKLN